MKSSLLCLGFVAAALIPSARAELKVGDPAPAATGVTDTGASLDFASVYKQQPYTLVYFYPKADTPGCTAQGCSLRDAYEKLTAKGVAVIGVSLDSVDAQKAFKEKNHFPFPLIADHDKVVVTAFGVATRKVPLMGELAHREAFLIKNGTIVWTDYKASTKAQADDVLKVIAEQEAAAPQKS